MVLSSFQHLAEKVAVIVAIYYALIFLCCTFKNPPWRLCVYKAPAKRGHIVAATLCSVMLPIHGKVWQHCCTPRGHRKCFWRFSEHFMCPGHKICVACMAKRSSQDLRNMITSAVLPPQCVLVLPAPKVNACCCNGDLMHGCYSSPQNRKGTELWLGIEAHGLHIFEKDNKQNPKLTFPWNETNNISFHDKRVSFAQGSSGFRMTLKNQSKIKAITKPINMMWAKTHLTNQKCKLWLLVKHVNACALIAMPK